MRGDDACTHDLVPALADVNLDEARDLAVHYGSVDVPEFLDKGLDGDSALARLTLVKPHVPDLGIGIRAPWYGQGAHPLPAKEEGVTNDDSRCRIGNVREFEARSDVSRGKDPAVGRAHPVVDYDSARLVIVNAGRFEPEPAYVGRAAGAQEYLVDHGFRRHTALVKRQDFVAALAFHPPHHYLGQQPHS